MKKQLKLMSLVLSIALLLISAAPITANAFDSIDMDDNAELITPSSDAIYSIRAADASVELCRALAEMNISIQNNTLIEVVPLEGDAGGTAIEITNAVNNTMTKDILVAPNDNGTFSNLTVVSPETASTQDTGIVYYPYYSNALVQASAVFFKHPDGSSCYQPQSLMMIYYSNGSDVVTNVDLRYICEGYVFTYPGMEAVTLTDEDIYRHEIPLFKAAPESNLAYWFSRPYRTDRIINTSNIATSSHHIDFDLYINNIRVTTTRKITG